MHVLLILFNPRIAFFEGSNDVLGSCAVFLQLTDLVFQSLHLKFGVDNGLTLLLDDEVQLVQFFIKPREIRAFLLQVRVNFIMGLLFGTRDEKLKPKQ